jgi:hypothetical protein|tara:strand:+ start:211 stop:453 length:243 start_codon:yes stop_codon:yes gene_type:complete
MNMQSITINLYQRDNEAMSDEKTIGHFSSIGDAIEAVVDELNLNETNNFSMEMWSKNPIKLIDKYYGMHIEVEYTQGCKG